MPLTQLSYLYILQHIHCTYCAYVQTEFPRMFIKMTQKQAQHVKWLALYQGAIHVTPFFCCDRDHLHSKEHAQICLCPDYAHYSLL